MKLLQSTSMSRLFRTFLLIASLLFVVFFGYQTVTSTSRAQTKTISHDRSSVIEIVAGRQRNVRFRLMADGKDVSVTERERENSLSISDAVNATKMWFDNNDVLNIKQALSDTQSRKKDMLEQTKEQYKLLQLMRRQSLDTLRNRDLLTERRNAIIRQLEEESIKTIRKTDENSKEDVKDASKKPIFIVILARMRTGSSLLGEIFNQNPSLFYLYEPLISLDDAMRSGQFGSDQHQNVSSTLLMEYSQCRFPAAVTRNWLRWQGGNSRSAKIRPLCQATRNCSSLAIGDLENICRNTHGRVCLKTIRADLDYFKPLVEAGVNVKIVHLVRDPRGTTNSRRLYYMFNRPRIPLRTTPRQRLQGKLGALGLLGHYPDHVVHTVPRLCQWTRDSVLEVRKRPAWLQNRYKLVRYEDFAIDPLRTARDIYDFIGIEYPRSVMSWIVSNTRNNDLRSVKLFSTHKNSIETSVRWRQSLRPVQVHQVEQICLEAMNLLGYKVSTSVDQLRNYSVSLMDPLPVDDEW